MYVYLHEQCFFIELSMRHLMKLLKIQEDLINKVRITKYSNSVTAKTALPVKYKSSKSDYVH